MLLPSTGGACAAAVMRDRSWGRLWPDWANVGQLWIVRDSCASLGDEFNSGVLRWMSVGETVCSVMQLLGERFEAITCKGMGGWR